MQRNGSVAAAGKSLLPLLLVAAGATLASLALMMDPLGLSAPGFGPSQFAMLLSGLTVGVTGYAIHARVDTRRLAEWLLVVIGITAVAFAADFVLLQSLPGFNTKLLLMASASFGALMIAAVPAGAGNMGVPHDWRSWLAANRMAIAKFLVVLAQLAALLVVIRQYSLENQAFYHNIMLLVFYGFIIHYLLPARLRQPFFALLSISAIVGVFGLANGVWLVGIGLGLIGICHLPFSFNVRVVLLLVAGIILALFRADIFQVPSLAAIWPVLGSMFMFRLIIYMYDLKGNKKPIDPATSLSYFFLLPNVVFPLFPVVDFSTFRRTYFKEEQHRIFQRGIEWILWGVIQLIAYRIINYYWVLAIEDVSNALELAQYAITNYVIYIRVSGQFFIIIGILHLFGFGLPRTHDRYFLASSFTDLWRRNNIYWKDFMQKVFYMPVYFRLNKLGTIARLALATAFVIFLTWLLHAYQWFWLRGKFLISAPDIVFWILLGSLVVANVIREARRGRKRTLGGRQLSLRELLSSSFRIAGTFSIMAILWSLWTSGSISNGLSLWAVALTPAGIATLFAVFVVLMVVLGAILWIDSYLNARPKRDPDSPRAFFGVSVKHGLVIAALFIVASPAFYTRVGGRPGEILADIRTARLSDRDADLLLKGYYEDLIGVSQFNSDLWDLYSKRPADWPLLQDTEAANMTDDFQVMALTPSTSIVYHGEQFSVNRWGMRDQDYELVPPPSTYRIALVGPSFVMGSGVSDSQVFEAVLEDRLNAVNDGSEFAGYQILNFAVAGHSALQELFVLENDALDFQPNAFFFIGHQMEEEINVRNLASRIVAGVEMPYEFLDEIAAEAGVEAGMTQTEAERRLKPFGDELIARTYSSVVKLARENGIEPYWFYFPTLESENNVQLQAELTQAALKAGFHVTDMSDTYEDQDWSTLIVAEWDKHPNARGHLLLAERMYAALSELDGVFPFNFPPND